MKVCSWRCFGSLVIAVSWLLSFLLRNLYVCFLTRSVLTSPVEFWKEFFRTLVETYSPAKTTWFVLHHVFHCCPGSASTYVPCVHKMHVAQHMHPEYHIQHIGGNGILPDSPSSGFLIESNFCKYVHTSFHFWTYTHAFIYIYIYLDRCLHPS